MADLPPPIEPIAHFPPDDEAYDPTCSICEERLPVDSNNVPHGHPHPLVGVFPMWFCGEDCWYDYVGSK